MNDTLTVIMPAHNAESTIATAIASTLAQTHQAFELWVLENGSTDRTAEIARGFADPRVRVFELGPVRFPGAIQYAIENARTDWLARMDADDIMLPNRLKAQMEVIGKHPDLVLVGTDYGLLTPFGHIFERSRKKLSGEVDNTRLAWGRFFADPSAVFSRRRALEVGGVDREFNHADLTLFFRLLTRGPGWEIAEPHYLYRLRPDSMSNRQDAYEETRQVRAKYAPHTLCYFPKDRDRPSNAAWSFVASLELLTGNRQSLYEIASQLEQNGCLTEARGIRWRASLGSLGCYYYRLRSRGTYRHRPDWERLYAPLLEEVDQSVAMLEGPGLHSQVEC